MELVLNLVLQGEFVETGFVIYLALYIGKWTEVLMNGCIVGMLHMDWNTISHESVSNNTKQY